MTKKELEQLKYLNHEAAQLQRKISQLKGRQSMITIDGLSRSAFKPHDFTRYQDRINVLQSVLQAKQKQCFEKLYEIYAWLDTIEDSQLRDIFMLRYVNNLSWLQVAFSIGEYDESYPRKKHNAFLKLAENAET